MATYTDTTLSGERVILDGNGFTRCVFETCEIVYAARGPVTLEGCTFGNCSYVTVRHKTRFYS
jgi:hypothetical protein